MWRRRPDAGGKLLPVRSCGTGQDGKSSHNWRASKVDADDPESSPTALWPSGDFTDSPASRYDTTPQCRISTLSHSAASAWLPARKRSKKNLRHLLFITLVLPLFTTRALGALRPPARVANRGAAKSIPAALSPLLAGAAAPSRHGQHKYGGSRHHLPMPTRPTDSSDLSFFF